MYYCRDKVITIFTEAVTKPMFFQKIEVRGIKILVLQNSFILLTCLRNIDWFKVCAPPSLLLFGSTLDRSSATLSLTSHRCATR